MTEKKRPGAPKRYKDRVTIHHSIDKELLNKVDQLADYDKTRTDVINAAITEYLAKS